MKQYTDKEIIELKEKLKSYNVDKSIFLDWIFNDNYKDGDFLTQLLDKLENP